MKFKKTKRKFISLCLMMLMIFSILANDFVAYAASAENHMYTEGPENEGQIHSDERIRMDEVLPILVTNADELENAVQNATEPVTIQLANNIALDKTLIVPSGKEITFSADTGDNITLSISDAFKGGQILIEIQGGSKLTLDGNITYDCTSLNKGERNAGAIYVNNSTLIFNSGVVENYHSEEAFSGAINVRFENGHFELNGGIIKNNTFTNQYCGAVLVLEGASFEMNEGKITSNESTAINSGGGVMVYTIDSSRGSFIMNNGEISWNQAQAGGGVHVFGGNPFEGDFSSRSYFEMNGGKISDSCL